MVLDGNKIVNAALHTYKEDGKRLFKGDLILEIDGKDVRQENENTLQSMLLGIIGSEVTVKVARAESQDIVSVSIIRGVRALGTPGDEQTLPDLTKEVKGVAEALYRELGLLREANGQLTEEISKARAVRGDYVKQLESKVRSLEMQVDAQRRSVSDKDCEYAALLQSARENTAKTKQIEDELCLKDLILAEKTSKIQNLERECDERKRTHAATLEKMQQAVAEAALDQAKVETLKNALVAEERASRDLRVQLQDMYYLHAKVSGMDKSLKAATRKSEELEQEVTRLESENKAWDSKGDRFQKDLLGQIDALTHRTKELEHALDVAKVKLEDSDIALKSSEKRNEQLVQAKEALERRLLDSTAQVQLCNDNLDRKQAEYLQSQKAHDEKLREKEKALGLVEEGAFEHRLRSDQLAKQLFLAEQDKTELVGKCDKLELKCAELERKLQQRQLTTGDMQKEIDRLETALSLEKRSLSSLADVQETNEKLRSQLSITKKDASDQKDLLWKAESDAKQLRQQAETEAKQLKNKISEKSARIGELEKQLCSVTASLQEKSDDAKHLRQKAETDAKQLKDQISEQSARIGELEKQLCSVTASLQEKTDKIQAFQKQGDAGKSELHQRIKVAQQEIDNLRQKLKTADASLCKSSEKVKTLDKQIEELKDQLEAARKSAISKSPGFVQASPTKTTSAKNPEPRAKETRVVSTSLKETKVVSTSLETQKDTNVVSTSQLQSSSPAMVGLGIRITEQQPHRITEVVEGGSGQGKLRVGDVLLKVDGKDTKRLDFKQVKSILLGPPASSVTLSVQRKCETGQKQVVTLQLVRPGGEMSQERESEAHPGPSMLSRPISETINAQLSLMQSVSGVDLSSFRTTGLFQ